MTTSLQFLKRTLAAALSLSALAPAWAAASAPVASTPSGPQELARITGEQRDSSVSWLANAEGGVDVAVSVVFPGRPLVAAEFIEKHTAGEVFLAVAPPRTAIPSALARREASLLAVDDARRAELQRENQEALAKLAFVETSTSSSLAAGCSDAFRQAVGTIYGSPTCGQAGLSVIDDVWSSDTYCTSGCDYGLGIVDKGSCFPALKSCDIVEGSTHSIRLRTTTQGSPVMSHKGHGAHFGVANCSGDGPVTFKFKRGTTTYTQAVAVGEMYHYYTGVRSLAPASAVDFVTYGKWNQGTPASGSTYLDNSITVENNSGVDDRVIACGDIKDSYDMYDISSPGCHGSNVSLCLSSNCDTACFNCVGGTCN